MATTTQQQKRDPPISQTTLLTVSAATFLGCLGGSVWFVLRKDAKQAATLAAEAPISASHTVQHITPTMTPSETRKASINARLFALKTLGLGTMLAVGTTGIMAVAVGWWLDVRNVSKHEAGPHFFNFPDTCVHIIRTESWSANFITLILFLTLSFANSPPNSPKSFPGNCRGSAPRSCGKRRPRTNTRHYTRRICKSWKTWTPPSFGGSSGRNGIMKWKKEGPSSVRSRSDFGDRESLF